MHTSKIKTNQRGVVCLKSCISKALFLKEKFNVAKGKKNVMRNADEK